MKIGVLLSGCGFLDGAEIRESVLTYLSLSRHNVEVSTYAPNRYQYHVVNHLTSEQEEGKRNILEEAARITRGDILPLEKCNPKELDGLILPGGFGVAKNFSNFAFSGSEAQMSSDIQEVLSAFLAQKKPIGTICISPAVINLIKPCKVTIGEDPQTASVIKSLGGTHVEAKANSIIFDEENNIVSTPAYMLEAPLYQIAEGIDKCVSKVVELVSLH